MPDEPGPITFVGRCPQCKAGVAEAHVGTVRPVWGKVTMAFDEAGVPLGAKRRTACGYCSTLTVTHRVAGTYSPRRACDTRCTSAVGPLCVCSCGGANHGHDHVPRARIRR